VIAWPSLEPGTSKSVSNATINSQCSSAQHLDPAADPGSAVEVDDVGIGHPNARGRYRSLRWDQTNQFKNRRFVRVDLIGT
jgi:hypothetical protein